MSPKKKLDTVIVVCIQEPKEDGSLMDFGAIDGDNLRFLHQAFITDTIMSASTIQEADVRLYYIDNPERKKLVKIISDYITKQTKGIDDRFVSSRFEMNKLEKERWGIRIEKIFEDCFKAGYENVLIIGSRTPTVSAEKLEMAVKVLRECDAVFGPTPEGRYYVIGMSGKAHIKLSEFDWKSPTIYHDVADALVAKELKWSELEIWYCVERTEELEMAVRDINQFRFMGDEQTAHETEKALERILSKLEMED